MATVVTPVSASEATLNQDPTDAAKRLRVLIRQALQTATGGDATSFQHFFQRGQSRFARMKQSQEHVQPIVDELAAAVEARRVVPGRLALKRLNMQLIYMRQFMQEAENYYTRAAQNSGVVGGGTPSKQILDEMHMLIQSLPTVKHAPQTPAEMVLHAIETILRNGGYGKFKGYQEIKEEVANAPETAAEAAGGDSVE